MTITTLIYNGIEYPAYQRECASQFAIPFAKKLCKGKGYDIGCGKLEWAFPGAIPIDVTLDNNEWDAMNLPDEEVDYIFSSHCLEHLDSWIDAIAYWNTKLKTGGVLFLYLPHYVHEYWRPWHNTKHKHCLSADIICDYLKALKHTRIFNSEYDLNYSFMIVSEKGS